MMRTPARTKIRYFILTSLSNRAQDCIPALRYSDYNFLSGTCDCVAMIKMNVRMPTNEVPGGMQCVAVAVADSIGSRLDHALGDPFGSPPGMNSRDVSPARKRTPIANEARAAISSAGDPP